MNFKQKFIVYLFGPVINFFESSLKISAFFVAFIFIMLVAIPIFRTKNKTDMDILRKVLIIIALVTGFIFGIIDTLRIRGIIQ